MDNDKKSNQDDRSSTPSLAPVYRLIDQTRAALRRSWVVTGAGFAIALFFGLLLTVAGWDLLFPLWPLFRMVGLLAIVVPALYMVVFGVIKPLIRRLGPTFVARTIERKIPKMHNRLVSCVDLDHEPQRRSSAFFQRLVEEALERIKTFRPSAVIDHPRLKKALLYGAGSVLSLALAFVVLWDRLPTAVARIFNPFADIPPASGVLYTVTPADGKVLQGDEVEFIVDVTKGDPEKLVLERRNDTGGDTIAYALVKQDDSRWRFSLVVDQSFEFRVKGGGTWTKRHHLTCVERPRIDGVQVAVTLPKYMGIDEQRENPPQNADVTGPEESTVNVVVTSGGSVQEGEIQFLELAPAKSTARPKPTSGLYAQVFSLPPGVNDFPKFDSLKPVAERVDPLVQFEDGSTTLASPAKMAHGFAVRWTGQIHIEKEATVTFSIQSDDGSRLYLDDKLAVDNGGSHSFTERSAAVALKQGWHDLRLEYFDVSGSSGMTLSYQTPEIAKRIVPTTALRSTPPAGLGQPMELVVTKTFPMKQDGDNRWVGSFPILGNGLWRAELRNELGIANRPMKEGTITAIPDNPPQIVLERPGADITMSSPAAKVPLVVSAFDDFGLADITLSTQRMDAGGFIGKPIKRYETPIRNDSVVTTIDLAPFDLKPNEYIRYRVAARDRKGQTAQTKEFIIRIAEDGSAQDRKLVEFDKRQDQFVERLTQLIAKQEKVKEKIDASEAKHHALTEKMEKAEAQAKLEEKPKVGNPNVPEPKPTIPLTPEEKKELDALKAELAALANEQRQNADLAKALAAEMKGENQLADQLGILPPQITKQMEAAQQRLEQEAAPQLADLAQQLQKGSQVNQQDPDVSEIQKEASEAQKELESLRNQLAALANARKEVEKGEPDKALAELDKAMQQQNAENTARDLADLQSQLAELKNELMELEKKQEGIIDQTAEAKAKDLGNLEKTQDQFEEKADPALAEARQLLEGEMKPQRKKADPNFPEQPFEPDGEPYLVPQKEQDTNEGPMKKEAKDAQADPASPAEKKDGEMDEERLFEPALGGPKPKLDPRLVDKRDAVKKKQESATGQNPAEEKQREELTDREFQKLEELDTAQQALDADQQALSKLAQQLQQATKSQNQMAQEKGPASDAKNDPTSQMEKLMQSDDLAKAMELKNRLAAAKANRTSKPQGTPKGKATEVAKGASRGQIMQGELAKLDPETRNIILQMQPKLREELLAGLQDEGPEGYKNFIRDYFQKLTKIHEKK